MRNLNEAGRARDLPVSISADGNARRVPGKTGGEAAVFFSQNKNQPDQLQGISVDDRI